MVLFIWSMFVLIMISSFDCLSFVVVFVLLCVVGLDNRCMLCFGWFVVGVKVVVDVWWVWCG